MLQSLGQLRWVIGYVCTYVRTYVHNLKYVRTYVRTYVRIRIRTYKRMYIITCVSTYVRTYVVYVRTYIRTYIRKYVRTICISMSFGKSCRAEAARLKWFKIRTAFVMTMSQDKPIHPSWSLIERFLVNALFSQQMHLPRIQVYATCNGLRIVGRTSVVRMHSISHFSVLKYRTYVRTHACKPT